MSRDIKGGVSRPRGGGGVREGGLASLKFNKWVHELNWLRRVSGRVLMQWLFQQGSAVCLLCVCDVLKKPV